MSNLSTTYYAHAIELSNAEAFESRLKALLTEEIQSLSDLEAWIQREVEFKLQVGEVMSGQMIDFYRDTMSEEKKQIHMHDQTVIQPLLLKYGSELDKKLCQSPYAAQLDTKKYGLMLKVRSTDLELFREENIPLQVREQELVARYNEIIGGLTITWNGEEKPYPYVQAQIGDPDRATREKAWRATREALKSVRSELNDMMNELVHLRHQIAVNAGFKNYAEYSFRAHNREYTIADCQEFYAAVEKHVVPVWDRLADQFKAELNVDVYRPWDTSPCTLKGAPFEAVDDLVDGVERMLRATDPFFGDKFVHMRENGLLDLESRKGKAPGGFCDFLSYSKNTFVFANFSPSWFALIALIHEMGHAVNGYLQVRDEYEWTHMRAEVAELYSHGMELLCLDKLNEFYPNEHEFRNAQREEIHRALNMLMGPLSGDMFQHWMYANPDHTPEERDAAYRDITQRFAGHPVDSTGLEDEVGIGWLDSIHFFAYPFYNIEYSISELGALQLLETYRKDPRQAIEDFKRGASADSNQTIAELYAATGVSFDFSDQSVGRTAKFVEELIESLA
ncbi:M3 family oligoendopeptidase [Alicyclobacillus dauci]|uniref:M3 family oligoendopeptidase n=1 Tax=Alicyclobacillus dauci TaxID=1475485 RepID=A0ABY6Z4T0_9BACL|nr:M3 family oligoendopeptidase [Alicyclobacillus dauci]WAH37779.1 M3 family oligoendopeptidase [Alicyclobacillus dauci]